MMSRILFPTLLAAAATAHAEDRVTVQTDSGAGKIVVVGTVLDWNGRTVRIKSGDGLRELPAVRVVDVETPRIESHHNGLAALDAGKPGEALPLLKKALAEEPRLWMRREILAALIRTNLALGDRAAAGTDFLALLDSDPATRHFELIPLDWQTDPPDAALVAAARGWLKTADSDAAKLLAASCLLFDPLKGNDAAETLGRLATSIDSRIYPLARAQLWRRQLKKGNVAEGEIARWEDRLDEIPEPLRGGAWWLVGQAWADRGSAERAATALLWLPLVYDADARLAAEATVNAADQLTRIGRTADAVVLYREATTRFGFTPAAKRAAATLERLAGK